VIKKTEHGRYRVRISHRGTQVATATFDRRKDAEAWERAQKLQLIAGTWAPPALSRVILAEAIAEFNLARQHAVAEHTWDTDEGNLRLHMPPALAKRAMSSITRQQLDAVWAAMLQTKARSTVSRTRNSVSSLFAWAVDRQYVAHNIVLDSKVPRGTGQEIADGVRTFSPEELTGTINAIGKTHTRYALLLEFAALTGLRWGELAALRVNAISEFPYPVILIDRSKSDGYRLKTTKSRRARRVPLEPRAVRILVEVTEGRAPNDLVFTAPRGGPVRATAFTRAVGWDDLNDHKFHDLRHTYATNAIQAGVNIQAVSQWLGHSSSATTLRIYSHTFAGASDLAGLAILAAQRTGTTTVTPITRRVAN
jgi:integrase